MARTKLTASKGSFHCSLLILLAMFQYAYHKVHLQSIWIYHIVLIVLCCDAGMMSVMMCVCFRCLYSFLADRVRGHIHWPDSILESLLPH